MSMDRRLFLTGACSACAGLAAGIALPGKGGIAREIGTIENAPAYGKERFLSHWNCTQAVLEALAPQAGLSPEDITRITTPFAAGMWNGLTCGSATGAVMAIGMRYGRTSDGDGKATEVTKEKMRMFMAEMKRRFGNLDCSALLGTDMATEEGIREAADKGLFKSVCPRLVEASVVEAQKLMA